MAGLKYDRNDEEKNENGITITMDRALWY
jgi:hypothetical protein